MKEFQQVSNLQKSVNAFFFYFEDLVFAQVAGKEGKESDGVNCSFAFIVMVNCAAFARMAKKMKSANAV